jgi:crossover junction endodeoxyribonuclease RuvC
VKILAIDPALNKSGWAVIDKQSDGSLIYIDSGIIKVEGSLDLMLKLKIIKDSITEIINKFRPDEIAIEEIFVNKNPSTSLKLGHARGVIIASCLDFEIKIYQ